MKKGLFKDSLRTQEWNDIADTLDAVRGSQDVIDAGDDVVDVCHMAAVIQGN